MPTAVSNRFHLYAILAISAVVVTGFARTYYAKYWFHTPPLTQLLHVHALVFSGWLALHFLQARLIATHRVDLHRRVGVVAAVCGYAMVMLGCVVAVVSARTGESHNGIPAVPLLALALITILIFGCFLTAALLMRRRSDWHKRLMLLATLSLVAPASARISSLAVEKPSPVFLVGITLLFVAWCWLEDWRKLGRVHRAYVIGGLVLVISLPLRFAISQSQAWEPVARWLTS